MTREEAIAFGKSIIELQYLNDETYDFFKMAVKALEQSECEDAVSRAAAIDALEKIDCSDGVGVSALKCDAIDDAVTAIKALPSAQPGEDIRAMCGECDAWNQYKNYPQRRE